MLQAGDAVAVGFPHGAQERPRLLQHLTSATDYNLVAVILVGRSEIALILQCKVDFWVVPLDAERLHCNNLICWYTCRVRSLHNSHNSVVDSLLYHSHINDNMLLVKLHYLISYNSAFGRCKQSAKSAFNHSVTSEFGISSLALPTPQTELDVA